MLLRGRMRLLLRSGMRLLLRSRAGLLVRGRMLRRHGVLSRSIVLNGSIVLRGGGVLHRSLVLSGRSVRLRPCLCFSLRTRNWSALYRGQRLGDCYVLGVAAIGLGK